MRLTSEGTHEEVNLQGKVAVVGTLQQIGAVLRLLERVRDEIPDNALEGLTIAFEEWPPKDLRPTKYPEGEIGVYTIGEKLITLHPTRATEQTFLHELWHHVQNTSGDKLSHREADRFARRFAKPRKKLVKSEP